MDASNPVQDTTRVSIGSIRGRSERIARQNLSALEKALKGKVKTEFPTHDRFVFEAGWAETVRKGVNRFAKEIEAKFEEANAPHYIEELEAVCKKLPPVPVSGLLWDTIPIHPPGTNEAKGYVACHKNFGGVGIDRPSVIHLVEHLDFDPVFDLVEKAKPYTMGTRKGFYTRCKEQLGRACVQVSQHYSKPQFIKLLEKRMPVNLDKLPNWGDNLQTQMDLLTTSFKSTAGAPYWKSKLDAIDQMQSVVLPMLVKAFHEDGLDRLFAEQPEMWLCELKNKQDRYEDATKKTRPYLSIPWHWQVLFSCLSQPFTHALQLFTENSRSRNAYGFSYAHGGGLKIRAYLAKRLKKDGDMTYIVYGDDVDFYYLRGGKVYRICPDFKQMDGSVDQTCINWTIDYVIHCFEQKFGTTYSNFWRSVAEEWKVFATQPLMLVDKTGVYRKIRPDGLMTGVVGTTLFDTVKSVVSYEQFVQAAKGRPSLLEEDNATAFFRTLGLEIKADTWFVEKVNWKPSEGELWTNQKFLGVQMKWMENEKGPILVPHLPRDEWYTLFLTPRRDMVGKESRSRIAHDRYTFDRMRGLLVTGAVFDPQVYSVFNSIMQNLDPVALVMVVQAGEGKGTLPEAMNVVGQDFKYDSSMGWPTVEWAVDLYSPPEEKVGLTMTPVFTCGEEPFRRVHSRPELNIEMAVIDVRTGDHLDASVVVAGESIQEEPEGIDASLMPDKVVVKEQENWNKRSKLVDAVDPEKPVKRSPTIQECIEQFFRPRQLASAGAMLQLMNDILENKNPTLPVWSRLLRPDMMLQLVQFLIDYAPRTLFEEWWGIISSVSIWPLNDLARRIGITPERLEVEARKMGIYVVGRPNNKFMSRVSLTGVSELLKHQFQKQEVQNVQKLAAVREEKKTATIEQVPALKRQEKSLEASVKRASEPPAVVNISDRPQGLPRLNLVPNLDISDRTPHSLREIGDKILDHNKIVAWRKAVETEDDHIQKFYIRKEGKVSQVLVVFNKSYKDGWLYFYNMILNTYREDTTRVKKGENWADYADREDASHFKIYKTAKGPIVMQRQNNAIQLIGQHARLEEVLTPAGKRVSVRSHLHKNNFVQISLSSGTSKERAQRLEKLLGEPVTFETLPLHEMVRRYDYILDRYGWKEKQKQQKSSSKSRSQSGGKNNKSPKRSTQAPKAKPPAQTQQAEGNVRVWGTPGERKRLFRSDNSGHQGQSGRAEGASRHQPQSVDRHSNSTGGRSVAKVETSVSSGGGN